MAYTTIDKPSDYFNTKLYTGNGTDNNATQSVDMGLQPDLTWIKNRNLTGGSAQYHHIYDSVRGGNLRLVTSIANAESATNDRFNGITSTGFDLVQDDAGTNQNNQTYVAWGWKANGSGSSNTDGSITSSVSANTTAGFSIVSYTGTGANATVGHGLSSAPKFIMFKNRTVARNWIAYHDSIGATKFIYPNLTNAQSTDSTAFNDTAPTSSVFSLGSNVGGNENGSSIIAYCFADTGNKFFKAGSYTGNGIASGGGPFIYLGFKPALIIIKESSASGDNWRIIDNKRLGYNEKNYPMYPSAVNGEGTEIACDMLSNGFKLRSTGGGTNQSGNTFIYIAFAENPFVTSTGIPTTAR